MKVLVNLLLSLVTVSSAIVFPDEQTVLSPVDNKNNDDRLNDIDDRLLALYEVDGMGSFREPMFFPSESWLQDVESSMYDSPRVFFEEASVFEDFDEEDGLVYAATAGDPRPDHANSGSSDMTIYQLIKSSQFTTKLAALIDADQDNELARVLNDTKVNHTVFVPTDYAFGKISKSHPQLSPGAIRKILCYHISPGSTHLGLRLSEGSYTVSTLYKEPSLGDDLPQRLSIRPNHRDSITVNFYAHLIASDIRASNGLIQVVDSILIPPPSTLSILNLLPTQFSTLVLGLSRTNLSSALEATGSAYQGGTFFAPSNNAFELLGSRITAFLFSAQGEKYLRALLEYHVVRNQTLYSDVLYTENGQLEPLLDSLPPLPLSGSLLLALMTNNADLHQKSAHVELPTMHGNHSIAVDIKQLGPFSKFMINGSRRTVIAPNGVARDGSIIVLDNVLIPPEKGARYESSHWRHFHGFEMCLTLEEFKARFAGSIMDGGNDDDFEFDLLAFLDSPSS